LKEVQPIARIYSHENSTFLKKDFST